MEGKKGKATIKTGGAGKFSSIPLVRFRGLLIHVESIIPQIKRKFTCN